MLKTKFPPDQQTVQIIEEIKQNVITAKNSITKAGVTSQDKRGKLVKEATENADHAKELLQKIQMIHGFV